MKKTLYQGGLFLLCTLLLPLFLTKLFNSNKSNLDIPAESDIRIYASSTESVAMTLDEYVAGVVLASIPMNYEYETLKAQAVIARTYALKNISICNEARSNRTIIDSLDPQSQGYTTAELGLPYADISSYLVYTSAKEYETYNHQIQSAVTETKGQILTYKKQLITPLFFSTSAGKTRNSGELWTTKIPYLISVDSKQDTESQDYIKVTILTTDSIVSSLQSAFQNKQLGVTDYDYQVYTSLPIDADTFFEDVTITKRDSAGYVLTLSLGGVLVSGDRFADVIGLSSSYFYIEDYEDSVRIICNGSGHGIGFSQFGANSLVKTDSYNYKQLLTYYYTGAKISKISQLY